MAYALVSAGMVVQIAAEEFPVHPSLVWVDAGSAAVGWSYANGTLTAPPAPAAPTLAEQAIAAFSAGLAITSTGTPALNGTYSCAPAAQMNVTAVMLYVQVHNKFPGGVTSYPWADRAGGMHVFNDTATFVGFATAIADYASALTMVAMSGTGSLPNAAATIA